MVEDSKLKGKYDLYNECDSEIVILVNISHFD